MIDQVYSQQILSLLKDVPHRGRLMEPDCSGEAHSRLCGSSILVDLKVRNETIIDFAMEPEACALGQASAAIVARHIIGAKTEEMRNLRNTMYAMLKDQGLPPKGRFQQLEVLEPVRGYANRHASTLLIFDAVVVALDKCNQALVLSQSDNKE